MKLKASLLSLAVTVAFAFNASAHERCCARSHKSCAPRKSCARHSCDAHKVCEGRHNTCAHNSCEAHEESGCHRHTAQWNWRHCNQDHKSTGHHTNHDKDNSRDDA